MDNLNQPLLPTGYTPEEDPTLGTQLVDGALLSTRPDGSIEVDLSGGRDTPQTASDVTQHDANLAAALPESELSTISSQVIEWVREDDQARSDWLRELKAGLELVGISTSRSMEAKEVIKGTAKMNHPLVMEAVVQFQARAVAELFPAGGPAKGSIVGESNEQLEQQRDRVEDYLNYCLTVKDPGYFEDTDQMLMLLPLFGSIFRKTFKHPVTKFATTRMVNTVDFLVPANAQSLQDADHYTHVQPRVSIHTLKAAQASGYYRQVDLGSGGSFNDSTEGSQLRDDSDGVDASGYTSADSRKIYECTCMLSLSCDKPLSPDGRALPYVVTMEEASGKVLAIYRNWDEKDELKLREVWYAHYRYLPAIGFYGWGLLHCIAGLGAAATGLLRAFIDGAARANFSGGFRSKSARLAGTLSPAAGQWIDVDLDADELSKAFFPLPFKEPGPAMSRSLEMVQELGQRFAATTEAMVGEAGNSGPVGTTMALIEQASKVFSAVHKRTHYSMALELRSYSKLVRDGFTGDKYEYQVSGGNQQVLRADFDDRVDVVPVSDPNISSSTQRIAQAQAAVQLIQQNPQLYTPQQVRLAHRTLLRAMRNPEADVLTQEPPPPQPPPQADPVTEGMNLMNGQPVKAYPNDDHQSHLQLHAQVLENVPPEILKKVQPAVYAHMAEHLAFEYQQRMQVHQQQGHQMAAHADSLLAQQDQSLGGGMPGPALQPEMMGQ